MENRKQIDSDIHFRSGEDSLENWFFFVPSLRVLKFNFIDQCYFINYHYYLN